VTIVTLVDKVPMPSFYCGGRGAGAGYAFALWIETTLTFWIFGNPFFGRKYVWEFKSVNSATRTCLGDLIPSEGLYYGSNLLFEQTTRFVDLFADRAGSHIWQLGITVRPHDLQYLASVFCGGNLSQAHLGYCYDQKANDTTANKLKNNIRFVHRDETSYYAKSYEGPAGIHQGIEKILCCLETLHSLDLNFHLLSGKLVQSAIQRKRWFV
jgi:hypothetical protein